MIMIFSALERHRKQLCRYKDLIFCTFRLERAVLVNCDTLYLAPLMLEDFLNQIHDNSLTELWEAVIIKFKISWFLDI